MHYYQHHIGDFIKDTNFLTNEEIGIYLKLIWLYYDTEKPLKNDLAILSMKTNARNNEDALKNILGMFFQLKDDHWHHARCDKEIEEYVKFCEKQRTNGLRGGRPKLNRVEPINNPMGFQDEPKKTLTTNHKPLTNNITPSGVSPAVFSQFLAVRKTKRATVFSELVLQGIEREASKAGITLEKAMTICVERNWVTFKADWDWKSEDIKKQDLGSWK